MVRRSARVQRATSNVDTASYTSSRTTPPSDDKDEGYQPAIKSTSVPPTTDADSYYSYDPSDTTTPALISYSGMCDNVYSTLPDQPHELLPGGIGLSTQRLPSTIFPPLLQPTLQEFISLPKKNADRGCSAASKGKGKASTEDRFYSGQHPTDLGPLDDEDLYYPLPDFSSTDEWVAHTRPILQDYANRQIPLPLGQRVSVSLNEPSQFIQGALQLLANRDHPKNPSIDPSRQLGPQLIENFTDVHRWATEYFRARFGMSTVGSDIPVLLTIITNTIYEAHTQLIDSIADAAIENMHGRGASSLDIEDFAFGYDFEMSQQLPFAVEASSRIHDTLEQHRPRSPLNLPVNLPTTTRFGRQIKVPKQAQAAALAESEKQTKARQRKKEQAKKEEAKKDQNSTTSSHETYKAVSEVTQKSATTPNPSVAGVMVCTRSASIYHTPNNGSLYHTPLRGIDRILRKVEANTVVLTGVKCPTCGRVMPSRMPVTPTHSASRSTANSNISVNWNSEQTITGTAASSNLKLAPITVRQPPLTVPWFIELPPSASRASSKPDATGHVNTTATLSEATTGTQNLAQAQAAPARGGRIYLRARGARGNIGDARGRGQGRDGDASAPITIVIPARPRPVTPASTVAPPTSASTAAIAPTDAVKCDPSRRSTRGAGTTSTHSANPVPTTVASSEARVPTKSVRPGSMNTTGGADHEVAVAAFARAYYSRCNTKQNVAAGSSVNAANSTKSTPQNRTFGPSGAFTFGSNSTGAHYPRSTTGTAANAAAGPSRGKAIDFSDPKLWITRARAAGRLAGLSDFAAQLSDSLTTNGNRVQTTVAWNKKRKLDNSG
ncbi:uncharacterized protein HD556DRAFT_1377513 [Suillus plorans]|uniref:Uncharacterized protein n=1 Tax=Suillus plorans TaxID=116603 RepID=A0A9P7AMR2_9AGAM|nr:uncharacterized protein HD556DRAFT_1377513 [Suillus plorans]KAG1792732.1 hypothetical protein HD556DRAFT_1377513 [Suillus plorans]